jgi:hypothetical protein
VELQWVVEWLHLQASQARDELVTATPETFMRKQGEAAAYDKLLIGMTRPKIAI